ncbi:MAG: hypothetical protein Kow0074_15030 [Candidatus Zixiibacteriota bacterium]
MKIEILYFEGCPNYVQARDAVDAVVKNLGVEATVTPVLVETEADATSQRFLGSPSIRVNGHDIEPGADDEQQFSLRCRRYQADEGMQGFPPESMIRAAILAERGKS